MNDPLSTRLRVGLSLCLAAATLVLPSAAISAPIASEAFNYADGALAGNNGGSGWGGAWTGGGSVTGGVDTIAGAGGFRSLGTAITAGAGSAVYLSFNLGTDSASTGDFAGLSFYTAGGTSERLFFGMNFNANVYGINVTGIANVNSTEAATVAPRLLIAAVLFSSATTMTANLYLDLETNLIATYTGNFQAGSWDAIRIASAGSPMPASTYDNIRIGTTLNDVLDVRPVPEPTSMMLVLAGLAMAGLSGRRRRH